VRIFAPHDITQVFWHTVCNGGVTLSTLSCSIAPCGTMPPRPRVYQAGLDGCLLYCCRAGLRSCHSALTFRTP